MDSDSAGEDSQNRTKIKTGTDQITAYRLYV